METLQTPTIIASIIFAVVMAGATLYGIIADLRDKKPAKRSRFVTLRSNFPVL
jgi:hypothetical protein